MRALPEDLVPADARAAYHVQDEFRRLWTAPVAGWKAGATAEPVQKLFGIDEPFCGPFFAPDVFASPASIEAGRFHHRAIESEFAFRFGRPLPARAGGYTRDEILAAVDALVPAIELVSPRFEDLLFGRATTAIADCAVNGGFVFGEPVVAWRAADLVDHMVRLYVDGREIAAGTGAKVLGDPVAALSWMVAKLCNRGIGIELGQILSTGTTTGVVHLEAGQTATADFGALGKVSVEYQR